VPLICVPTVAASQLRGAGHPPPGFDRGGITESIRGRGCHPEPPGQWQRVRPGSAAGDRAVPQCRWLRWLPSPQPCRPLGGVCATLGCDGGLCQLLGIAESWLRYI